MASIDNLKVGEIYSLWGRRARIEAITPATGGNPASVTVMMGRNLDQPRNLSATSYRPDFIRDLQETWNDAKERKGREREFRRQADQLSERLSIAGEQLGINGGAYISKDGRLQVYGNLESLGKLVAAVEDYAAREQGSALGELLS